MGLLLRHRPTRVLVTLLAGCAGPATGGEGDGGVADGAASDGALDARADGAVEAGGGTCDDLALCCPKLTIPEFKDGCLAVWKKGDPASCATLLADYRKGSQCP